MLSVMTFRYALFIIFFYGVTFYPVALDAQKKIAATSDRKEKKPYQQSRFFDNDDILHFKLVGKLSELFNDRNKNLTYHPMLLQYRQKDSSLISIQLMAKTRGHFRRLKANCKMPPLLLNFPKAEKIKNSVFENQNKLKLVVPCEGDEYVIKEWLVYKAYNIITEKSFKAKLVQVEFEDSSMRRKTETHYCILIEDEKKVAARNKCFVWNRKMVNMKDIDNDEFKKMAVFQYMIGNTDWGVPYLQNIVLITKDTTKAVFAIPYDFDHAGIVDAPYAGPAEELEISSVRERLYRGYCESDKKNFAKTFELFNRLKNDIYNVYTNCSLLKPKYVKTVTSYLDDFYETINSSKKTEAEFQKPCKADRRVEIKGLKD
jgi:hypothetical protein